MGNYSVPEAIRKLKPKGTMVKALPGGYSVYEYSKFRGDDGKQHTKMGKIIGSIKEGIGFVPNNNYNCDFNRTVFEFGDYAILMANSKKTLALLKECFNPLDAVMIYTVSIIHLIQQFSCIKAIQDYFDMSFLSIKYPTLKVGYDSISNLYVTLGSKRQGVLALEEKLIASCSNEIAIDGHVIGSKSQNNDMSEKGYKFSKISEPQVNLLMAYDVNTKIPLISRFFPGSSPDKVSVKEVLDEVELRNALFVIDRGFYSEENLKLFTQNDNNYIIPLARNLTSCKQAVNSIDKLPFSFLYDEGDKNNCIEYKDEIINGNRVLVFRDLTETAREKANYRRHIKKKDRGYTEANFQKFAPFLGVIVLQTSLHDKEPEEIYRLYKKRWSIEIFYKFLDNDIDFNGLYQQDYYAAQGLAFIMQVCGLIYREFEVAVKDVNEQVEDCLRFARKIKAQKMQQRWLLTNCEKKHVKLFKKLNAPLDVVAYLQGT